MFERIKKYLAPVLLILLLGGVAAAIYISNREQRQIKTQHNADARITTVSGLIGSEKEAFLSDPRVLAVFQKNGIDLKIEKSGSRQIAVHPELKKYDFGFPAGTPAAIKIMQQSGSKRVFPVFFTPMAVASWKPIVALLIANGLAHQSGDHVLLDMEKLTALMTAGKRWKDLASNSTYAINKGILISTTDVRKSNSAAQYLALTSYILNGDQIVQNDAEIDKLMPQLAPLFLRQGFQEASSAGPFEDYTTMGMGKAPLVLIYESQFLEYRARQGQMNPDMVLLYPTPTIFTKHALVAFNDKGARVGALLERDAELNKLAVEYGFRNANQRYATQYWKQRGIPVPQNLIDVVDPPAYEILEKMIQIIEKQFD